MTLITKENLATAISLLENDRKDKEAICDEIFREQPNLLGSVLVLTKMNVPSADIEVLLEILMVTYLALKESGKRIRKITEDEQERELKRLVASIKFSGGMAPALTEKSMKKYVGFKKEPWLLAYVVGTLQKNGTLSSANENTKYLFLSALNLVGCMANAKRAA